MKKIFISLVIFTGMIASVMVFSSFNLPKEETSTEYLQSKMATNDAWKLFRENVPYCDAEHDKCEGYGKVWVNTDTYQVAFQPDGYQTKYDLSEYTKKEGYNMRFWWSNSFHYVNIYVPKSVFE